MKKEKIVSFFNKNIPQPIALTIIIIVGFLACGFVFWQYLSLINYKFK